MAARIVIVGGSVIGTLAGLLLQQDGHHVTVLERDGAEPPEPSAAWDQWPRAGVTQFRQPHGLLARFRALLGEQLPELLDQLIEDGALCWNPVDALPAAITGGRRPGDARFDVVTARRPAIEASIVEFARSRGLDVQRGAGVRGLAWGPGRDGVVDVLGVVTDEGELLEADLVVDAGGRRSAMPAWLQTAGAAGPIEEIEDCGFVYFGRHFRSADGSMPAMLGPTVQSYGSFSAATLPADRGTWSVVIFSSSQDLALRGLRHVDRWSTLVRACPLIAHWIEAEPITGVDVMARIEDRRRWYFVDGTPVATGVVPVGDAWASTNPSLGRGITIGLLHAVTLRDALREVDATSPRDFVLAWQQRTAERVEPFVSDTLSFDRHRLAEMRAKAEGRDYDSEDPGWRWGQALRRTAARDPDLLRSFLDVAALHRRGVEVLDDATRERVHLADGGGALPGPDRAELVTIAGGGPTILRASRQLASGRRRAS